MAIDTDIQNIQNAVYGESVRGSIINALRQCYEEHEELAGQVGDLERSVDAELFGVQKAYAIRPGLINASYNWFKSNDDMAHVIFPIEAGDSIDITANASNNTQYAFLTDNVVRLNNPAPTIPASTRYSITKGTSASISAPDGSKYLYILYSGTGGSVYFPSSLKINGIDRLLSINDRLVDCSVKETYKQNPDDKYVKIANGFEHIKYTTTDGGKLLNDPKIASMILELNNGSVFMFDETKYSGTYSVLSLDDLSILLPNKGWNNSGRIIVDTEGLENARVIVSVKKNDNENADIREANESLAVLNRIKEIDLFMFMGQSNMAGRGITNSTWTETYPTIIPCAGLEFRAITDKTRLYPMAEPFGKRENKSGGIDDGSSAADGGNKTGGLAVAFANEYYKHAGVPVVGVSASEGGTGIQSWITGSENLTDALQRLSDAITYLNNNGYIIRHKFMLWCQGESDTRLEVTGDQYKAYFSDIMATMKNAGIEKCFLIRIGEYNGTGYDYSGIINAQTDIAQDRDDTVMATTILASYKARGMMKDQYHYYQAAYNEIGRYAGVNVAEYVNSGKEPTMYDPKNSNLYFCHKN